MKFLIILSLLFSVVFCLNGVDISVAASTSDLSCLVKQGYTFAIVRCFRSSGVVDTNCASNVANSHAAGMDNVDIYLFPCFKCGNPLNQMNETLSYATEKGVKYNTLWLDIEGPSNWGSVTDNVNFFTQLVRAGENLGATMGIYTSKSQWVPIMGTSTAGSIYPLWYANYDKVQSFGDFSPFGGWQTPHMKQYSGDSTLCGLGVDLDWLPGGSTTTASIAASATTHATVATTHTTVAAATHAASDSTTHAAASDGTTHAAATTHTASNGPSAAGPTDGSSSTSKTSGPASANGPASSTSTGPSSTGQTSGYSSGGDSGSASSASGEFSYDQAIYNTKLGGKKITIVDVEKKVQEEKKTEGKKEVRGMRMAEVEDAMEKDSHFKVVEERSFNKFNR